MASTRAEQAEKTRRTLLDTAQRLFAEHGYDATSLQMIADAMDVTKANVYYYFHTKAEILEAITDLAIGGLATILDTAETIPDRRARLEFVVDGFVDLVVAKHAITPMNQTDPGMRRHDRVRGPIDALTERGMRVLFGDRPTLDEQAAYYLVSDLGQLIRRFPGTPVDDLRATLKRLCLRLVQD
ncbi:TetR/AcrR family transcriptional regulator [Sphaerisporangium corydalis]|uniref:TetR/AcrR family transcriptional regulator n=1 Tax=Sphaerisporangium corydalis TaxID=1441875 RepID=A0ABV9E7X5_9ACTN|nr:TetR/AcrR family transcriptional regulator [Sphaerisporangium corydalis]